MRQWALEQVWVMTTDVVTGCSYLLDMSDVYETTLITGDAYITVEASAIVEAMDKEDMARGSD